MASIANGESGASARAKINAIIDNSEVMALANGTAGLYGVLQSNYTLTSTTAAQKLFNWSTNGALTLPTGIYLLETRAYISGMSATSGNAAFSLAGTATLARIMQVALGGDTTTPGTAGNQSGAMVQAAAFTGSMTTAAVGTGFVFAIRSVIDVTATGTVIPSIALVTAAAAVVNAGSWFQARRLGPTATATGGTWT